MESIESTACRGERRGRNPTHNHPRHFFSLGKQHNGLSSRSKTLPFLAHVSDRSKGRWQHQEKKLCLGGGEVRVPLLVRSPPPSKRSCRRETISGGQHFRIEILMPPPVSFDLRSSCQAPCWKYGLGNKRIRMDDRYSAIELLLNNEEGDRDGGRWQEEKIT